MPTNPLGPGVSRYIDGRDRQFTAVVFQYDRPPLDAELNLVALTETESKAEATRATHPSGWATGGTNPYDDFKTDPHNSNLFFFGHQVANEVRSLTWAVVNGWWVPVAGTQTGAPPLAPNDADTWNKILLNPPSASTGGNRAEFVFLEVWLARIDVDPAPPGVAPGKPQRESLWRFGNVEGGFSFLTDDLVDPNINYETTRRVQLQYRIRVVADIGLASYPEGFDPSMVHAQGMLAAPIVTPDAIFHNMREQLGDPGLWRAGTGDPTTFGTADGYVYAIPICAAFRRNSAGFSDTGNLAGAFNRNSLGIMRADATTYTADVLLPVSISDTDVSFTLTSISGTVLETMNSFGEAYFKIDDEVIKVNSVTQLGPTAFFVTFSRGALNTTPRAHYVGSGNVLSLITVRPDGLFADQVAVTDILDLRHAVSESFDYENLLKTNLVELLKGNLRTAWKRYGSTNVGGPLVFYGDRITDSTVAVGGLTRLDGPNGNRRVYSDAAMTERYSVAVQVPSNTGTPESVLPPGDVLNLTVLPYNIVVNWADADPTRLPGARQIGAVDWWFNGDKITLRIADFQTGLPVVDADQVRFVLPSEDSDAVIIRFEGMTTDPNGGEPQTPPLTNAPTTTNPEIQNPSYVLTGERILKHGQGLTVTTNVAGDLIIEFASGTPGTQFNEFTDALAGAGIPWGPGLDNTYAHNTVARLEFAVVYGTGRGLSHKPQHIHTVNYLGAPGNSTLTMLRPGLSTGNRMIPTYLGDSPLVQSGKNRTLARTSEVMIDPGSKTVYVAPYRNMFLPKMLVRSGYKLNWWNNPIQYQGLMPGLSQDGLAIIHPVVDPLQLFYHSTTLWTDSRYIEIPIEWLPRPGLHHIPIVPITDGIFPSGINFLLMSKEGPITGDTSDWNRNLISYPATPGYYVVTPVLGEVYGTVAAAGLSVFGQKYVNHKIHSHFGGPFKGIQFPPFYAPARITGVYYRDPITLPTSPVSSPFDTNRHYVGGVGTDVNLLRDDFDGATILLDVDVNGDPTFVLSADVIDPAKMPTGMTFDNSDFLVECTLFGFDRGFLQTNGRILTVKLAAWSIPVAVNNFTTTTDNLIGVILPAPLTVDHVNNEITFYYSRQPYQGDVFGTQGFYQDDPQRLGPLNVAEANSINTAIENFGTGPLGLALPNRAGYEVLASLGFVTSLGTGRMSGSNPIPLLSTVSNPDGVPDYEGTLVDLDRRFSLNRVGYDDWTSVKFPVLSSSLAARPAVKRGALSEVFDRDLHPEFAGCISNLPLGIWFRDKDFVGKTLYQTRSMSNNAMIPSGTLAFPPFQTALTPTAPGVPTWEGVEFVCGNASNTVGVGGEALVKVDGTGITTDITIFKTTRGGAAWSVTGPWVGGEIAARIAKAKPNSEVGGVVAGMAYLVRSQPERITSGAFSLEVHPGHELQMVIVTHATPSYFRETEVVHSASGVNEGYTAADRFRIWGRPLERHSGSVDTSILPVDRPVFVNDVWDDPIFFGSSDPNLTSMKQEVIPVSFDGQTLFPGGLSARPLDPTTVQAWLNGVKLTYGVDYTVGGPPLNRDFTFIPTGIPPVTLVTMDTLEIWFVQL